MLWKFVVSIFLQFYSVWPLFNLINIFDDGKVQIPIGLVQTLLIVIVKMEYHIIAFIDLDSVFQFESFLLNLFLIVSAVYSVLVVLGLQLSTVNLDLQLGLTHVSSVDCRLCI